MLITVHPVQSAPRASFLARVRKLWLIPFMDLKGGSDVGIPLRCHPIVTIGIPQSTPTGNSVVLGLNKVKIPANNSKCILGGGLNG